MDKQAKRKELENVLGDLGSYFNLVLSTNLQVLEAITEQYKNSEEMEAAEYGALVKSVLLPPQLLSCITSFLKNNDVMVLADDTAEELDKWTDGIKELSKSGTVDLSSIDYDSILPQ